MRAELLALFSAASFAASHVASKRGLRETSVTAGFLAIVAAAWLVVLVAVLLDPPRSVSMGAVVPFAVSGLFAPAVARAAALMGVHQLGPSITVPIQQGLRPLLVLPAAAILLGEGLGPARVLGVTGIVAGGWILSRRPVEGSIEAPADAVGAADVAHPRGAMVTTARRVRRRLSGRFRLGIIYPVAAALAYAIADLIVKSALESHSEPAFGAVVSIGTGLGVWVLAHAWSPVRRRFALGRDFGWLVLSGGFMGSAILLLFNALERGEVSIVASIVATQPLFVFVFSTLLLRHLEHLQRSTVLAGVIVVVGTVLVSA